MRLNATKLRTSKPKAVDTQNITRFPLVFILDGVVDTFNIGSFFRLADAVAASKLLLCGQVVTPPNIKIHRASVGTWKWVPWEHFQTTTDAIASVKQDGYTVWAVEQAPNSHSLFKLTYPKKLALVVGNESTGISKEVISLTDKIIEIPMFGINTSLNVLISATAVTYQYIENLL